jgi:hypothetical protein
MGELKPPKFKKDDVIIKNCYRSHGIILGTVTKSDEMGSYVGFYDKPGETTYTVEYVQLQKYDTFSHYCYKLKEAGHMFIHDSSLVDIEFDLYQEYMRRLKLKKILDEIQNR